MFFSGRVIRSKYPEWLRYITRKNIYVLQEITGLSIRTLQNLKSGKTITPAPLTESLLYDVYYSYWYNRLHLHGVPFDYAKYLINNFPIVRFYKEEKQRLNIARHISKNRGKPGYHPKDAKKREKYKDSYHPVKRVLEGMARSYKKTVGDWVIYIEETYDNSTEI